MEGIDDLGPHRAVDARGPRVENPRRDLPPVLLAAGDRRVERVVAHPDDESVARRQQGIGGVDRERGLPPSVHPEEEAVDPHRGLVIDGVEVDDQPLAMGQSGLLKPQPVPHYVVGRVRLLLDSGETRLPGERNADRPVERPGLREIGLLPAIADPDVIIIKRELPPTAQVEPPMAAHLWPWVTRSELTRRQRLHAATLPQA